MAGGPGGAGGAGGRGGGPVGRGAVRGAEGAFVGSVVSGRGAGLRGRLKGDDSTTAVELRGEKRDRGPYHMTGEPVYI